MVGAVRWWEQRESNPRPSACKADALNQLSYAPVFRFFWLITASDFVSLLLTTSRLLRRPSLVFLVLNQNKLQNSFVSVKELPFKGGFSERDCKGRQKFRFCKFFAANFAKFAAKNHKMCISRLDIIRIPFLPRQLHWRDNVANTDILPLLLERRIFRSV